jgi:hypothetical protein
MDALENANRVLSDLERKLSIALTTLTLPLQASSVIVHNLLTPGCDSVSSVLQYIKSSSIELDADRLFIERQRHLSSTPSPIDFPGSRRLPLSAAAAVANAVAPQRRASPPAADGPAPNDDYDYDYDYNHSDLDSEEEFDGDAADDAFDLPSPPRSPPREVDPDKLYGLYDFSGPDPLHCTLARDEPVYLLSDEDNYWWLVQKASDDDEPGRIGFVPAECLETYGERLARLNCFKNEELERLARDVLGQASAPRATNNKVVTFDDLGDLVGRALNFDDEDDDDSLDSPLRQQFPNHIFSIPAGSLSPAAGRQQGSEVLSEVFSDKELVVSKRPSPGAQPEPATAPEPLQPPAARAADVESIGTYLPDTPPRPVGLPRDQENSFQRSVILDRLNQMTADIQEQFLTHDESYTDMENIMFGMESREELGTDSGSGGDKLDGDTNSFESGPLQPTPDHTGQPGSFTPSTSTASLVDRGKEKTIHDMFVPILGKFDELAERLEELNEILG